MAGWSDITIDADLVGVYERGDEAAKNAATPASASAAVRQSLRDRLRRHMTTIIDSEGVTESVFLDELADMAAATDVRQALDTLMATEHLYRYFRAKSDRPARGEQPGNKRDLYDRDAERLASGFAALVRRALDQDEITFDTGEITREQESVVTWIC